MISIQSILLVALGFLCASFVVLLVGPAFWRRAVRMTTQRLKESLPITEDEIRADKDRIRVEYAMQVHRLEKQVKDNKLANARRLIEINRRDASISAFEMELERSKASLEENQNARRVLEQTVADRLPRVEQRLAEAKRLLFNRDRDIDQLKRSVGREEKALAEATSINEQQAAQIERLNMSLATRAAKRSPNPREAGFEVELALRAELEAMRSKTRDQAALIGSMQSQVGAGIRRAGSEAAANGSDAAVGSSEALAGADSEMSSLEQSLSDAQDALKSAASGSSGDEGQLERDAQLRKMKSRIQDQTGEIACLKAALSTFEEGDGSKKSPSIRDSKIALKARLNAVQVQAEQQSHVIQGLRADLAAAHERTAMQAQHFTTEMRRLGAGTLPAAGTARKKIKAAAAPASLAERIAQPRSSAPDGASQDIAVESAGSATNGSTGGVAAKAVGGVENGAERSPGKTNARNPAPSSSSTRVVDRLRDVASTDGVASSSEASEPTTAASGAKAAKADKPQPAGAKSAATGDSGSSGAKVLVKPKLTNGAAAPGHDAAQSPEAAAESPQKRGLLDRITGASKG